MALLTRDFVIDVGSRWKSPTFNLRDPDGNPLDLTGYTAKMHIRDRGGRLIVELSTTNGKIYHGGALGTVDMSLSASDTVGVRADVADYDLEMYPDGDEDETWKLCRGKITFVPEVTRG